MFGFWKGRWNSISLLASSISFVINTAVGHGSKKLYSKNFLVIFFFQIYKSWSSVINLSPDQKTRKYRTKSENHNKETNQYYHQTKAIMARNLPSKKWWNVDVYVNVKVGWYGLDQVCCILDIIEVLEVCVHI
jgi:hypothetical protein